MIQGVIKAVPARFNSNLFIGKRFARFIAKLVILDIYDWE